MFNVGVMDRINAALAEGAASVITRNRFFELEIAAWKASATRRNQLLGDRYYNGDHDILRRQRQVIGADGRLETVHNLPNNRIVDNKYGLMVDQKKNYLLGNGFTLSTKNAAYQKALQKIFDKRFHRTFKNLGEDSINGAVAWLCVHYDETGALKFKRFAPYEVLPFWRDSEHTTLDCALRLYQAEVYEGDELKIVERVELYTPEGVEFFDLVDGVLVPDAETPKTTHVRIGGMGYNWERLPLIPFRYNSREIPLIVNCKSLQDGINTMLSDFENNLQEDARNTILVIKNYDGVNLGEFRRNLAAYGAVKVRDDGGISTLTVDVNAENYKTVLDLLKKSLVENCRGFDAKDDRMTGTPNQMNIQSMYSDIDLDANEMETEYQAAFEDLLWFVNVHLANTGAGRFSADDVEVTFKRNILMNTAEHMKVLYQGGVQISNETLLSQVPFVEDVKAELARVDAERTALTEEPGHEDG
jgi:SPP1 family phage portal protein